MSTPGTELEVHDESPQMTLTGWQPDHDLSFDEWAQAGQQLQAMGRAWQWWLGDWVRYGEARYGDLYAQAIDLTGYEYQTIANVAYVASRIDFSRRRENLSWSHHAEVAALPPSEQTDWLDRAEEEGMTRSRLRSALSAAKRQAAPKLMPEENAEFRGSITFLYSAYDEQAAQEKLKDLSAALEKRGVSVTHKHTVQR
jgi:hypothetical protein